MKRLLENWSTINLLFCLRESEANISEIEELPHHRERRRSGYQNGGSVLIRPLSKSVVWESDQEKVVSLSPLKAVMFRWIGVQ